jgi:hypothetical protein
MNRLTDRSKEIPLPCTDNGVFWARVHEKLARYEDTELEPEEVERYAKAEKDGRLLVLPCKVGDMVYYHFQFKNKRVLPFTRKAKVKKICCNRKTLDVDVELMDAKESGIMKTFRSEDFGKTVYLTREDAEKALEGMNNDER